MNRIRRNILSFSLVFMTASASLGAMELPLPTRQTLQAWLIGDNVLLEQDAINAMNLATDEQISALGANYNQLMAAESSDLYAGGKNILKIKEAICGDIAVIRDHILGKNEQSSPHNAVLAVVAEPTDIVSRPKRFDVSLACKLADELAGLNNKEELLFSKTVRQNSMRSVELRFKDPRIVEGIDSVVGIKYVDGKVVATVTDETGEKLVEVGKGNRLEIGAPVNNPEVNNPPVDGLNDPIKKENRFAAFNAKPVMLGLLGVCGVGALSWKLYKNSSYYQGSLIKSWQAQADAAIGKIGENDENAVELPAIEVAELTRLNDVEREQLAQAHVALQVAFAKAQSIAATPDKGNQASVAKELKGTHAQWNGMMNDCKHSIQKSATRFW